MPSWVEQAWGLEELGRGGGGGRRPNSGQGMPLKDTKVGRRFSQADLEGERCRPWRRLVWLRQSTEKSIQGTGRTRRGAGSFRAPPPGLRLSL